MKTIKELYMEEVHSASLKGIDAIIEYLKEINIALTAEQEDFVYIAMDEALEKISNGNYRREM